MPDDHVTRLLDNCILELIPMKTTLDKAAALPEGATVSVTASPDKGMDATVDLALQLVDRGFRVIPHLSARATKTRSELESIVRRLEAGGIDQVFVVGGDATDPGEFFDALEMLEALETMGHHFIKIGVTGYPEGHPNISDDELMAALIAKRRHAAYIATQMCFDPATIESWIRSIRAAGVDLPITLGVPGAVAPAKLLTIGARIGVGQSLRYLRKNRKAITKVLFGARSVCDDLITALAPVAPELGIDGLHVFTFNAVAETADWWQRRRATRR
jgi:methylenetetrahydrofolate reductase (NADPH)